MHAVNGRSRSPGETFGFSPWEVEVPFENVEFTAKDGVRLRGWWFPRPGSRRVVVGLPGHLGTKGDLLGIGSALWRHGDNVLLFDFRGVGDSDTGPASLAYHEVWDAHAAIEFANARVPAASVGVIGYSMGAAVALITASRNPSVLAVVADSSFATMGQVIGHAFHRRGVPKWPTVLITDWWNRIRYGYSFADVRPIDAVGSMNARPVLFIHGTADTIIPEAHAHELFAAAVHPKELWIVDEAAHCGAYFADRAEYVTRVAGFFDEWLPEAGKAVGTPMSRRGSDSQVESG